MYYTGTYHNHGNQKEPGYLRQYMVFTTETLNVFTTQPLHSMYYTGTYHNHGNQKEPGYLRQYMVFTTETLNVFTTQPLHSMYYTGTYHNHGIYYRDTERVYNTATT